MSASQQTSYPDESVVFSLLEFADSQLRLTGIFEITIEALCERLGIPQVDAYRALYRSPVELSGYIPDRFNLENMNVLAMFLSQYGRTDAEKIFRATGAHLGSDDLSELAALYYDVADGVIGAHTPQKDEYRQMYTRFKTYRRAFDVYVEYFFDMGQIFEDTVAAFLTAKEFTFPHLGRFSAHKSLTLLFERNVISISGIFESLFERLTGESSRRDGGTARMSLPALRAMGLTRPPRNKRELRLHYKTLMKTYHPDLNPSGLEMSKKINAAYSELLASWIPPG